MDNGNAKRAGQWLELEPSALLAASRLESAGGARAERAHPHKRGQEQELPVPGTHSHDVRQWLLTIDVFPAKWVNRLFSIGGIQWNGEKLRLLAFAQVDPQSDPLYRKAMLPQTGAAPLVLYEDDYCLVLLKPAGMAVHESAPGQRGTLDEAAARHMLEQRDPLPVRHIHRLDDDTSGPVLYAKNDLAQWKLDEAMRQKAIGRHYIAVVHGQVAKASDRISLPIGKDRHHRSRRRVSDSGEPAVTHYEVIAAGKQLSLLRLRLETGRTHQIRVHMSHIGHPLAGDGLYGGDSRMLPHQALHGERILFPHPWTNSLIEAEAPWPDWLKELSLRIQRPSN